MSPLPADVFKSITAFLADGRSGDITLRVNNGVVCAWGFKTKVPPPEGEQLAQRWDVVEYRVRSNRREWVDSGGGVGILPPTGK